MLPYRLRTPVFGNYTENRKRKLDGSLKEVTQFGGPVQRAIWQDLQEFRERVVHGVTSLGTNNAVSHWKRGEAFQFFKQHFGSAKIALLHLLVPHPRCDREAYAQIIYAACLDLLKDSMKANNLLDACISIMILYTLYETCPLLRTEKLTPPDYLPNGLKDSRAYRRAFRQPIRIDQEHFLGIMRLQAQCGAHVDRCRGDDTSTPLTGIAQDTIIILDRLYAHWDFCDYTGPVGLEALAGHSDYPYRENNPKATKAAKSKAPSQSQSVPVESQPVPTIPLATLPLAETDDVALVASLQEYQKAIQSIHLGNTKSALATQLRKTLAPILPINGKKSWFDMIQTEPSSIGRERTLTDRLEHDPIFGTRESSDDDNLAMQPNTSLQESHPKYQLQLSEDVSTELRSYLQHVFQQVAQRGEIDLMVQSRAGNDKSVMESDVSTLGDGGVSLATGQGRMALQNLLTSAQPPLRVPGRVSMVSLTAAASQEQNLKARFLQSDYDLQSSDDDGSSVVSNLSIDSDLEENNDEESVATSAVGRRALNHLLKKVSKEEKGPKLKSSRKKQLADPHSDQSIASSIGAGRMALDSLLQRAAVKQKHKISDSKIGQATENRATATSSRQRARMSSDETTMPPPKARTPTTRPTGVVREVVDIANDDATIGDYSMASSIGPGEVALRAILQQATAPRETTAPNVSVSGQDFPLRKRTRDSGQTRMLPPKARTSKSRTRTKRVTRDVANSTNDDMTLGGQSVASSIGPGEMALRAISDQATARVERKSSSDTVLKSESRKRNTTSRQTTSTFPKTRAPSRTAKAQSVTQEIQKTPDDDLTLGDQSMASSIGPGEMALRVILGQSTGSGIPNVSTHTARLKASNDPDPDSFPPGDDDTSMATSVGPGEAALDALLGHAKTTELLSSRNHAARKVATSSDMAKRTTGVIKPSRDHSSIDLATDDISVATSSGPGEAALIYPLNQGENLPSSRNPPMKQKELLEDIDSMEKESISSVNDDGWHEQTGPSTNPRQSSLSKIRSSSKKGTDTLQTDPVPDDESIGSKQGEMSIASSVGPGKAALGALLKTAKDRRKSR